MREEAGSVGTRGGALRPVACVWGQPWPPGAGVLCAAHLCTLISSLWDHSICVWFNLPHSPSLTGCILFSPFCHPRDFTFSFVALFLHLSHSRAAPGHATRRPRLVSHGFSLGPLRDLPRVGVRVPNARPATALTASSCACTWWWCIHTRDPRPPVLPQLWRGFLRAGRAVCGHAGPPAAAALPLPAGACQAACPPALRDPALPQLVHLFLEGGEAWGSGMGAGVSSEPSSAQTPSPALLVFRGLRRW